MRYFLWPFGNPIWLVRRLRRGGVYGSARDAVWEFVTTLRLPHYFRLGLLGFAGTMAWLLVPVTLIALGRRFPPVRVPRRPLARDRGAMRLPFLQMRFVVENRFAAFFEYRAVRDRFRRAPWASLRGVPDPHAARCPSTCSRSR